MVDEQELAALLDAATKAGELAGKYGYAIRCRYTLENHSMVVDIGRDGFARIYNISLPGMMQSRADIVDAVVTDAMRKITIEVEKVRSQL